MTRYTYTLVGRFPAPFVHITLRSTHGSGQVENLPAQLDTGSDRTLIPQQVIQDLGLIALDEIALTGLEGAVQILLTFLVQLIVHQHDSLMVEVVGGRNEPWILLGRDVLNHFRMILDGPNQRLEFD